jgi:hypothetical protein
VPNAPLPVYKVGSYKTAPLSVYLPDGSEDGKPWPNGLFEVPQTEWSIS